MSLNKVTYKDKQTVITAKNLNDIQDSILELENSNKNFIAIYQETTYEEVKEAYDLGKTILFKDPESSEFGHLSNFDSIMGEFVFSSVIVAPGTDTTPRVRSYSLYDDGHWIFWATFEVFTTDQFNFYQQFIETKNMLLNSGNAWKYKGSNSIKNKEKIFVTSEQEIFYNINELPSESQGEAFIKIINLNAEGNLGLLELGYNGFAIDSFDSELVLFNRSDMSGAQNLVNSYAHFEQITDNLMVIPSKNSEDLMSYDVALVLVDNPIDGLPMTKGIWLKFYWTYYDNTFYPIPVYTDIFSCAFNLSAPEDEAISLNAIDAICGQDLNDFLVNNVNLTLNNVTIVDDGFGNVTIGG